MKTYKGEWTLEHYCSRCDKHLSRSLVFHNNGVCPYCGHYSGCTILSTKKQLERKIYKLVLWIFPVIVDKEFKSPS